MTGFFTPRAHDGMVESLRALKIALSTAVKAVESHFK